MHESITKYARLGLVHHLLYPECSYDPQLHIETLSEFVKRTDIETFDCCIPYGEKYRNKAIDLVKSSNKEDIVFAMHLFPLRKLSMAEPIQPHQQINRLIIDDMIEQAHGIRATGFIFVSGPPAYHQASKEHFQAFSGFCKWLCKRLEPYGMTALLEPFDTDIDKKFMYGPTEKCVELLTELQPEITNIGIELDMAHIPLMHETFEHAIKTVSPFLKRVHLGNCVLKDRHNSRWGDTHPPIGFPGGEIDIDEICEIFNLLLETGFLQKEKRGSLVMEMTPWPGKTAEETIVDTFSRIEKAWSMI